MYIIWNNIEINDTVSSLLENLNSKKLTYKSESGHIRQCSVKYVYTILFYKLNNKVYSYYYINFKNTVHFIV